MVWNQYPQTYGNKKMITKGIISLIGSLEPFKQCFNGNVDKIRLVAVVSPT
jgi:hypothetical protein